MKNKIIIRSATIWDADSLLNIYKYYVENTAISFEYETPSVAEFKNRIAHTLEEYPYLIAEQNGKILGYAYASRFHERAAYSRCAEVSIYVDRDARKCGVGKMLYHVLEEKLQEMGIINLYACITWTDIVDEYLDNNSTEFHAHLGYTEIGKFHKCGYKFERWYDMIWMEKIVGEHI